MESVFHMSNFMEIVTKVRLMIIRDLCNEEWTNTSKTKSNYWLSSEDQVVKAKILQALHSLVITRLAIPQLSFFL